MNLRDRRREMNYSVALTDLQVLLGHNRCILSIVFYCAVRNLKNSATYQHQVSCKVRDPPPS